MGKTKTKTEITKDSAQFIARQPIFDNQKNIICI